MFRRKKSFSEKFFSNQYLILFLVIGVLLAVSVPLAKNISKKYEIDSEVKALEEEIAGLQKKNKNLKKMINKYTSDDFVEEVARLNLGLKKEGEEVLLVRREEGVENISTTSRDSIDIKFAGEKVESNPKKWLKYFLGG